MVKRILVPGLLVASVAAVAATLVPESRATSGGQAAMPSPMNDQAIRIAISDWNRLRQSDSLPFADYARFLVAHPGWPGEAAMRRTAEKRLPADPAVAGIASSDIVAFFTRHPPLSNTARLRYAEALAATGRQDEAKRWARAAWVGGALAPDDESRILTKFGSVLGQYEHDARMERLLWDRSATAANRLLPMASSSRRPVNEARIALQQRSADVETKVSAAGSGALSDPGFVADRARYLRDTGQSAAARALLARRHNFSAAPLDAEKWLEVLLVNARAAATDGQSTLAYDIASQADTAFPAGTNVRERSLGERDDYTSVTWLAGTVALEKLGRPRDAIAMYDRYGRAAQSPQTQSKGHYWAGRAAQSARDQSLAERHYRLAAQHVDQFYGQLATERLNEALRLPAEPPAVNISGSDRAAFEASEVVRAARILGQMGRWQDQTQFIRVIAQNAKSDADHVLAGDLARSINRPDLGVIVSRLARSSGTRDPVRIGFPQLPAQPVSSSLWVMAHAITRQESQFDREALSHAGARGLMQLMPGTAAEQARKLGLGYDITRLTSDPAYNIQLGSSFFQRMLDYYNGSHVLAVAAYNAGPGNVNKWLRANGDPRMSGVDVVDWIEAIPFTETRGYVQRVLENAVVYDLLHPARSTAPARNRLSAYLGKTNAG